MKNFFLEIPTRIYFGRNGSLNALRCEQDIFGDRVMIISTSKSLRTQGFTEELMDCLEEIPGKEIKTFLYNDISPEPQLSEIERAVRTGKEEGITSVIGFGGGSSIDAAKAAALGIGSEKSVGSYYYDGIVPTEKKIPVIAIPTTAGTGSELSGSAVISDTATNTKKGIRGRYIYPALAIVDPRYSDSMPSKITRDSGFDAFAHAVETFLSVKATRFSDLLAEDAVKLIASALPALKSNPSDKNARDMMCYASMIMGVNIGNVGTLLPHRLQYPVGMKTHTAHGEGLAALFPAWIREEYQYSAEKVRKITSIISGTDCSTEIDCVEAVRNFISSIGQAQGLAELGVQESDIPAFAESITGVLTNDPAYSGRDVIERIYRNSMRS